jgi:hypothetical protein
LAKKQRRIYCNFGKSVFFLCELLLLQLILYAASLEDQGRFLENHYTQGRRRRRGGGRGRRLVHNFLQKQTDLTAAAGTAAAGAAGAAGAQKCLEIELKFRIFH